MQKFWKKKIKLAMLVLLLLLPNIAFGAVDFDEINDGLQSPHSTSLDITGAITISLWVNEDTFPSVNGESNSLIGKGYNGTSEGFFLRIQQQSGDSKDYLEWGSYDSGGDNATTWNFEDDVAASWDENEWHHIGARYHDVDTDWEIFFDGVEQSSTNNAQGALTTTRPVWLGAFDNQGTLSRFYGGKISEVAIYDTDLTDAQMLQLASSRLKGMPLQIQSSNLQAYWPLDEIPDGTILPTPKPFPHDANSNCKLYWNFDVDEDPIQDQTSNNNDGTLKGADEPNFASGQGEAGLGCFLFDGSDDYIYTNDLDPTNAFTIMFWVNVNTATWETWSWFVSEPANASWSDPFANWGCARRADTLLWQFITSASDTDYQEWTDANTFENGEWHHYAVTRTGTSIVYYKDGVVFETDTHGTASNIDDDNRALTIGSHSSADNDENYGGYMDELAIYFSALTAAEILNIAAPFRDLSGNGNHLVAGGRSGGEGTALGETVLSYPPQIQ